MINHADPLVGRVTELELLEQSLDALPERGAHALAVIGPAGIGKSRLLAELTARANAKGYLVLSGAASELERDLPFGVFVDAMDDYVASVDARRLSRLEDEVQVELGRVFPAFAGYAREDVKPLQHERYRSHRAARALAETLATKPIVLILDDFHWADGASVELAAALIRRPPAAPVMLVLAARPGREGDVFAKEMLRAEQAGDLVRIELEPLSLEDSRALLPDDMPAALATSLHEESGGIPFYLEQLARGAASRSRAASMADTPDSDIPPAVALALRDEIASLDDSARRVLEGAAVAGDPFEPDLAAAGAGVTEDDAVDALDTLLRAEFVRPTEVPRRFRFRHPLVRRAVYESSPAGWRLGAHERVAAALAGRGAGVATRAPHVERSARQGDRAAIELLQQAGDEAAARAPANAARFYASALRLLPDNAPAEQRVELLLARADALMAVRRLHESVALLETAVDLTVDASPGLRARTVLAHTAAQRFVGHVASGDAARRLLEARESLPQGSREWVAIAIALAIDGFWRGDYDAMRRWARQAVDDAEELGDAPLRGAAYATLALTHAWMSEVAEASAAQEAAAAIVDSLSDPQLAERLDAAASLAAAELYLDRYADCLRHAERALVVSRKTGQEQLLPSIHASIGNCWTMDGHLAEAAELYSDALEAARVTGDEKGLMWVLLNRSTVMYELGDIETAYADAKSSVALIGAVDDGLITAWARMRLAFAEYASGDSARAVETMIAAGGGPAMERLAGSSRTACLAGLAAAQTDAGFLDDARATVETAEECADALGLPFGEAMAGLARAELALAEGDAHVAVESARRSIAASERAGALLYAAVARVALGRALGAAGEREEAVRELSQAVADLNSFGAARYRKQAEQELRRLGERIHRRTRAGKTDGVGLEALTERELEIARLAADRLTNREIAERLFLSKKTIETHMRNLFTKLNVNSRVEVARAIDQASQDPR